MLQYGFMQNAFIVSFFIGILCPSIGLFLVLRRYSLIGDTLSHSSLAGVTLALASGINPILGAFIFTTAAGALIEALRNAFKEYQDLILSIVLSLSVGILFIRKRLNRFFFGFNYRDCFKHLVIGYSRPHVSQDGLHSPR